MKFLSKLVLAILVNAAGLFLVARFIESVTLTDNLYELAVIALALTLLNYLFKPVLKLLLGPLIVLTLGIGILLVNVAILWVLDFLFDTLTIGTIVALLEVTFIFTVINVIFHLATRKT